LFDDGRRLAGHARLFGALETLIADRPQAQQQRGRSSGGNRQKDQDAASASTLADILGLYGLAGVYGVS
jgi:hypothetical protein